MVALQEIEALHSLRSSNVPSKHIRCVICTNVQTENSNVAKRMEEQFTSNGNESRGQLVPIIYYYSRWSLQWCVPFDLEYKKRNYEFMFALRHGPIYIISEYFFPFISPTSITIIIISNVNDLVARFGLDNYLYTFWQLSAQRSHTQIWESHTYAMRCSWKCTFKFIIASWPS